MIKCNLVALFGIFLASASTDVRNYYKNIVSGKDIDEVNRIRRIAFSAKTIGGFNVDSNYWFESITKKINLLKKVDDKLANDLINKAEELL
ncbi:MAG: hypothetical protein GY932_01920 [Arcobacter sp.]|nr:hypothetical protein [Arcobacter sp.]